MANTEQLIGVVKFFIEDKGYGFVTDEDSGVDYFFHVSKNTVKVEKGQSVSFDAEPGKRGMQAVNIKLI